MSLEQLAAAIVAAWVSMRLVDEIIKPLWEKAALDKFYLKYTGLVVGAGLAWFTGLNAFPVFAESALVGRIVTCIVTGLGPSFLYDLVDQQPSLPT